MKISPQLKAKRNKIANTFCKIKSQRGSKQAYRFLRKKGLRISQINASYF